MDIGERAAILPHLDHLDWHRVVPELTREQSLIGVTRRRFLLHGYRRFEGHILSEILPDHTDYFRFGFILGSSIRGNAVWFQRFTGSSLGSRDGRWFLALQCHEVAADNHTTASSKSRLGEDRAYLQVYQTSHHQSIATTRAGNLDIQVERERSSLRLCHSTESWSTQMPSSSTQELLHIDRCGSCRHTGWISAESWQWRVLGEFWCYFGVVSCDNCLMYFLICCLVVKFF